MQKNIVNFANEAAVVNSNLVNKSIELSVKSVQEFVQISSEQVSDWLKVKTLDDYVQTRENWNSIAMNQSKNTVMSTIELNNEICSAYLSLWQRYANTDVMAKAVEAADKKKA